MKHRSSFASRARCALGLCVPLLAACGGRYQIEREDPSSGGTGAATPSAGRGGSVPSFAGSSSAGWTSGGSSSAGWTSAGWTGGGSSSAGWTNAGSGSVGAGGGGSCINVKCASPICLGGATPVTLPGQCCPTSCSACPPCPALKCPPGTHTDTPAGECCPSCVSDPDTTCKKGQQAYAMEREAILNKYSYGCASSSECVAIAPVNLCEQGCSYAVVWYGVSDSLEVNLSNAADAYCSGCKPGPIPPCAPPPKPICLNGRCSQ